MMQPSAVATRETDSRRLPAGWNGREVVIPSLREHLHSAHILIGPHPLEQQVLALGIQQIFPVINPVHDMKAARLGLVNEKGTGYFAVCRESIAGAVWISIMLGTRNRCDIR